MVFSFLPELPQTNVRTEQADNSQGSIAAYRTVKASVSGWEAILQPSRALADTSELLKEALPRVSRGNHTIVPARDNVAAAPFFARHFRSGFQ
jgi:hypothetical protein